MKTKLQDSLLSSVHKISVLLLLFLLVGNAYSYNKIKIYSEVKKNMDPYLKKPVIFSPTQHYDHPRKACRNVSSDIGWSFLSNCNVVRLHNHWLRKQKITNANEFRMKAVTVTATLEYYRRYSKFDLLHPPRKKLAEMWFCSLGAYAGEFNDAAIEKARKTYVNKNYENFDFGNPVMVDAYKMGKRFSDINKCIEEYKPVSLKNIGSIDFSLDREFNIIKKSFKGVLKGNFVLIEGGPNPQLREERCKAYTGKCRPLVLKKKYLEKQGLLTPALVRAGMVQRMAGKINNKKFFDLFEEAETNRELDRLWAVEFKMSYCYIGAYAAASGDKAVYKQTLDYLKSRYGKWKAQSYTYYFDIYNYNLNASKLINGLKKGYELGAINKCKGLRQ